MRATDWSPAARSRDPLARIEEDVGTSDVELCIQVGRKSTGEILFEVGDRWNRGEHRFTGPADVCKTIWLNEAQCLGEAGHTLEEGPAWEIKTYIEARRRNDPRIVELVLDGARGSGKTVLGTIAVFLIAIEFPDSRCALVPPANTRRGEIEIIVKDFIPAAWRVWSKNDLTYKLPNHSVVAFIGADDEDSLKQGGFEVMLLNEAQLMTSQAYVNATAAPRNVSGRPMGLLILALNYASKERGAWTEDHLEKIDAGLPGARRHKLDPALNEFLAPGAVTVLEGLARSARPDLADLDYLGIRRRLGNMAAPAFRAYEGKDRDGKPGHIGNPPTPVLAVDGRMLAGWQDVTRRETARKTDTTNGYPVVVICDFQRRPGCVAGIGKLYQREDGKIVYHIFHSITASEQEDDLARQIDSYLATIGLTNRDALAICDATGKFQNASHSQNTKPSHAIMKEWAFTVVAPTRQKTSGGTSENANPLVEESLAQFFDVCTADRFMVAPTSSCEFVAQSLRRCKTKKRGNTIKLDDAKPGYSHYVDLARYFVAYFEPKRGPAPPPSDPAIADEIRKIRLFSSG